MVRQVERSTGIVWAKRGGNVRQFALDLEPLGLAYVFAATALGLAYDPAYVWAHFNTDMPLYNVHLDLAMFLTAPMVAFLLVDVVRVGWLRRRATKS